MQRDLTRLRTALLFQENKMRISSYFFGSTAYARPFLGELTHIKDVFEAKRSRTTFV